MTTANLSLLVLVIHTAATFYMVGLIWFVQRVHYPLFAGVGRSGFADYEQEHVRRTSPVVGPPMLVELATALLLVAWTPERIPAALPGLGLALLGAVWLSTLLLQVPRHRDLEQGFDERAHRRLVSTNWLRTGAWTLRAGVVLWMWLRLTSGPLP